MLSWENYPVWYVLIQSKEAKWFSFTGNVFLYGVLSLFPKINRNSIDQKLMCSIPFQSLLTFVLPNGKL
jgi:hypothetical protein